MAVAAILDLCIHNISKLTMMSEMTFLYEIHVDKW